MESYVKNPETGKLIKVDGPTFNKLKNKHPLESAPRIHKKAPSAQLVAKPISAKLLKQMIALPVHRMNIHQALQKSHQPHIIRKLKQEIPKAERKEERGQRTRGWVGMAPQRGRERHLLKKKCGDKCFLIPESESFPICPKNSCQLSCQGLMSAKIRAHQYKYTSLYPIISQLEKKCVKRKQGFSTPSS
jgi:hypothetical protein